MKVPLTELDDRLKRFRARMDTVQPGWEMVAITGKIPLYYFTGTMPDGLLLIPQDGDAVFWVRQSFEQAARESLFPNIRRMRSYRDIAEEMRIFPSTVYIETEQVPVAQLQRIQKHLPFRNVKAVDEHIGAVRAKKSPYELALMERAGEIHRHVLEDLVPGMLTEGIDEVTFTCDLYSVMVKEGHQGIIRFGMFNEMLLGQIGFGTSSISPTCVDTPGGISGTHPSVPLMGCRNRLLKKGDLVVIDIGCGYNGYQTDKTLSYMFGRPIPDTALQEHFRCVEIQDTMASMLKPGAIPSEIYRTIMAGLEPAFLANFPQTQGASNTFGARNFSSPVSVGSDLKGMSYSFDFGTAGNNARFVIIDDENSPHWRHHFSSTMTSGSRNSVSVTSFRSDQSPPRIGNGPSWRLGMTRRFRARR